MRDRLGGAFGDGPFERRETDADDFGSGGRRDHHPHHHGHHRHGRHGGRFFDYGELRLLVLDMLMERPSHGYELIKAIEERLSGVYSPSPGVIYPTLSWLTDMGYTEMDEEGAGRKTYRATSEGAAFLVANRAAVDQLLSRVGSAAAAGAPQIPDTVLRAMENLKTSMRLRLRRGPLDVSAADTIAAALDAAARAVERS